MPYSERYARRALRRMGLLLRKCRLRTRSDLRYSRYTILDENNRVALGSGDFDLDLADVTGFIDQLRGSG